MNRPEPPPVDEGKPSRRRGWGPLRPVLAYTRGLIVDQHLRRLTMFYLLIVTMVMVFIGALFVFDWREHPRRFVLYWVAVGWLTMTVTLLAMYDLLLLRVQHRLLRRELRKRMLGEEHLHQPPDGHDH